MGLWTTTRPMAMQAALGRSMRRPRVKGLRRLSYPMVPLNEALPQFAEGSVRSSPVVTSRTRDTAAITQLRSGLTVASESAFGQFCAVGVIVRAGSRCELSYPSGVTHVLSRMAANSTEQFEDKEHVLNAMNAYGGALDCQMFRDVLIYVASAYTHCLPDVMKLLSEVIWRPCFTEDELEQEKAAVAFELEDMLMRPDPQPLLEELIYQAAYRDNTLGLPMFCPQENLPLITTSHLRQYVTSHFTPERMTVAGCGVDHNQLVELAEEYFVDPRRSWEVEELPVDGSLAQYTGGEKTMHRSAPPVVGPNPLPDLNHVVLAMEGVDYFHPDLYTFAVMNSLMGGGGSFSAGGPGKGMYSQLYLNVLNQYESVYSALAQNFSTSDAGLFCLFGSAAPSDTRRLTEILCKQFFNMAKEPSKGDLARAKKQLQSNLMMNLEARLVQFENVARQALEYKAVIPAEELCANIEAVTAADLARIGEKMLHSRPSLAVLGDLQHAPPLEEVEKAMASGGTLPKKNRLFSFS